MAPTILTDEEGELRESRRSVGTSVISYVGRMSNNDDRSSSSSSSSRKITKKSLKGIRKRTTERTENNKLGTILNGILINDLKNDSRDNSNNNNDDDDDNSINNNSNGNNDKDTTSNGLITDNNLLQLQYNGQYNDETKENFITLEDNNSSSSSSSSGSSSNNNNDNNHYINNDNGGIEECPLHVISGDVIMIDKTDGISYRNCSCKCVEYFMNKNRNTVPRTIIVKNKEEKILGNITMKSIKLMRRLQLLLLKCKQFKIDIEPLITAILAEPEIEQLQFHSIDIESTVIVRNPTQSIQLTK